MAIAFAASTVLLPGAVLGADATCKSAGGATVEFCYDPHNISPGFGELSVVGNAIFATPTELKASAAVSGSATVAHDVNNYGGTVTVNALPGYRIAKVTFGMGGDYAVPNNNSWVWLDASFMLDAGALGSSNTPLNLTWANTDGETEDWSVFAAEDVDGWGKITTLDMSLDLTLGAHAEDAGVSFIQAKAVGSGIMVYTAPVPVPGAIWLFGSGLALLGAMNHRRRRDRNG